MSRRREQSSTAAAGSQPEQKKGRRGANKEETEEDEDTQMQVKYKVSPGAAASGLPLVVKATLSCLQANRDYESILIDVGLVAKDSELVKKVKKATATWSEDIRKDGKGHQHGPPHLRAWAALLQALTEEDVGGLNKEKLGEALKVFTEKSLEQKGTDVRMCRLRKTYDKTKLKLQFAVRGEVEHLRAVVRDALAQSKVEMKSGRAPTSAMERKLQEMLESWQI